MSGSAFPSRNVWCTDNFSPFESLSLDGSKNLNRISDLLNFWRAQHRLAVISRIWRAPKLTSHSCASFIKMSRLFELECGKFGVVSEAPSSYTNLDRFIAIKFCLRHRGTLKFSFWRIKKLYTL